MIIFSTFLIGIIFTTLLIPIFVNMAHKFGVLDMPNSRKVHSVPIPRIGGVAMAIAAFAPILIWAPKNGFVYGTLLGAFVLITFGVIDDFADIGFRKKFVGQIIAALIVVLIGGVKIQTIGNLIPGDYVLPDWVAMPLTVVVVVAVTNAINLSDGLDGLAGGISLVTFLFIGYLAYLVEFQAFEVMVAAFIGALLGLLRYNTHPAKVFMGDAGSQLLGFVAITLSLAITKQSDQISPVLLLLVIGVPVIDTVFVMVTRMVEGRSPFSADKSHLHHRLMRLGLYHSEAVVLIYLWHLLMVCSAFIFKDLPDWQILSFYLLVAGTPPVCLYAANKNDWQIERYPFIDKLIKGPLRRLRENNVLIKVSFRTTEIGFVVLLMLVCLLPRHVNIYLSFFASAALVAFFLLWMIKKEWAFGLLEATFFLIIPFIAYFSEAETAFFSVHTLKYINMIAFGGLVAAILLTLKFTRRNGFKSTPLDFLILIIALVIPNLPDIDIQSWQMGFVATKIIVFYFTYEVLKGELRLSNRKLGYTCITALLIIGIRGLFS